MAEDIRKKGYLTPEEQKQVRAERTAAQTLSEPVIKDDKKHGYNSNKR